MELDKPEPSHPRVAEGEELLDCGHATARGDRVVEVRWGASCRACADRA